MIATGVISWSAWEPTWKRAALHVMLGHYVSRPSLDKIFSGQKVKAQRDISINAAHMSHGYTLKEIADYLRIHYLTVSKVIAKAAVSKK